MNRMLLSYLGLLSLLSGCATHTLKAPDAGRPAAAVAANPAAAPADSQPRPFNIKAADATDALNEFSRQADVQVLFDFGALRGRQTLAVMGSLPPEQALASMLKNTGLVYAYVNDRTVAIKSQ